MSRDETNTPWESLRGLAGHPALRAARRLVVTVVGTTVLIVGVAFLVLPGPAFLVIPLGLGILATEYVWARRLLERVASTLRNGRGAGAASGAEESATPTPEVLVLAGARGSERERAFVRSRGAAHRALIEVADQPLLLHVLRALHDTPGIGAIHLVTDPSGETHAKAALERHRVAEPARWHASAATPARSVLAALSQELRPPLLLTTADHALLTPEILEAFLEGARSSDADFVVGVVPSERVLERFPDNPRTILRFRGERVCGANLFYVRKDAGRGAIEFWTRVEDDRKHPLRLLRHFGVWTALRFVLRRLRFDQALQIAGRRFGCRVAAVRLPFAEAAVDVDQEADRILVDTLLRARQRAESGRSAIATTWSSRS